MKMKFTIYDFRFSICKKSDALPVCNRKSSIINHKSQSGVALIITLILLSVTLLMALAFLAISNRERTAVSTSTDIATARLAADAGLAAAEAQIAANLLAGGTNVLGQSIPNPYNFGLLASTNYVPLSTGNLLQDLNNMQFSPRAPVWLTNFVRHIMENRYYLDLNRNGLAEANGQVASVDNNGMEAM